MAIDGRANRTGPFAAYTQEVAPWYPPAYCYVDAAEFLLQAVQNYRADTMKEAMNLYEDTMHKKAGFFY